jgi:hypothetical protein
VAVQVQLGHQMVGDPFEKILTPVDVAVQRHRLDPELLAEPAHGQRGQAVLVDERDGGLDDPVPGQRRPLRYLEAGRSPMADILFAAHSRLLAASTSISPPEHPRRGLRALIRGRLTP